MTDKKKLKVEYWDIEKVIPYASNPRDNDSAVIAVKSSIKEFGFVNPIVVDHEGVVVAGHTRLKAAYELEMEKVPVVVADHLTEKQAKAFRIIDNSTSSIAGWDVEFLQVEMEDLSEFGFEFYGLDVDVPDLFEEDIDGFFQQTQEYTGGADDVQNEKVTCPQCSNVFVLEDK